MTTPAAADARKRSTATPPPHDAAPSGLSRDECARFVDHAIAISLDAHNKKTAPELRPTADQLTTIRAQLRSELAGACTNLPRSGYRCAMAARTTAEFLRCGSETSPETAGPNRNRKDPGQSTP